MQLNLKYRFCFLCFLIFSIKPLQADQTNLPNSAEIDNRHQQRQQQQDKFREQQLSPSVDVKFDTAITALSLPPKETPCYILKQIQLSHYQNDTLHSLSSTVNAALAKLNISLPYCFGGEGVSVLMKQIQNEIIDKGFVTTKVVAPEQDLTTGILQLKIIEGRIRHLRVEDSSKWARFTRLTAWTAMAARTNQLLNIRDIEQSLENLKRIPTADATIEIVPAEDEKSEIGQSDLHIHYVQALPLRLSLSADDGGSKSTGKWQGSSTLSIDHLFTANDLLY